jgi:hypothetical protein
LQPCKDFFFFFFLVTQSDGIVLVVGVVSFVEGMYSESSVLQKG